MTLQQVQQLIRQKEGLARGTVQATITRLVLLHTLMQRPRILSLFSEESLARYGLGNNLLKMRILRFHPLSPFFAFTVD